MLRLPGKTRPNPGIYGGKVNCHAQPSELWQGRLVGNHQKRACSGNPLGFVGEGVATVWHHRQYDYVIVPLSDGRLVIEHGGIDTDVNELTQGGSYFRASGVEHDVRNGNDFPYSFVEIELL